MTDLHSPVPITDTHCHLGAYPRLQDVVDDLAPQGVSVIVATSRPSEYRSLRALLQGPHIQVGLGLHPECASSVYEGPEIEILAELAPTARWISEIGLDAVIAESTSASFGAVPSMLAQLSMLQRIMDATTPSHCYSVHSRGAEQTVLDVLSEHGRDRVVLHSFAGGLDIARRALDLGFRFSVGAHMLEVETGRQFVRWLPRDRILVETDGPYFSWQDRRISPVDCPDIARALARVRGEDPELLMHAMHDCVDELNRPLAA